MEKKVSDKKELTDQIIDEDLNILLDSALDDFVKVDEPPIKTQVKSPMTTPLDKDEKSTDVFSIDETWSEDFIKQTAERFEKNFQELLENADNGDLESSLRRMAQSVATTVSSSSENTSSEKKTEFQATVTQALKDISAASGTLQNGSLGVTEADLPAILSGVSLDDSTSDMFRSMQEMMQSLLSKAVLYPSLKELMDKYPEWLQKRKDSLSANDFARFSKQHGLIQKICAELESEKDNDAGDIKKKRFDKVLELMNEMQTCGQPPEDLIEGQISSLQVDNEGNPSLPPGVDLRNCNIM